MAVSAQALWLDLPGGRHQAVLEKANGTAKGLAYVAHPHPMFGGTMDNKVVQTVSRAFVQSGWDCLRFNFRGVGQSEGRGDFVVVFMKLLTLLRTTTGCMHKPRAHVHSHRASGREEQRVCEMCFCV